MANDAGRPQADEASGEAERMLELVEELGGIGHWRLDFSTGKLAWSPRIFTIHGLSLGEEPSLEVAVGMYHPDDRPAVEARVAHARATGEGFAFRARLVRADGVVRWISSSGRVSLEGGQAVTLFGIMKDVTDEQVELEASASRVQSLATLAAGLAHEINNPMTSVVANLHLLDQLLDRTGHDVTFVREARDILQDIGAGAQQVRSVVRDLQRFTGRSDGEGELFAVDDTVRAALSMVRAEIRTSARLEVLLDSARQARGRPSELVQAVVHLLRNAAHAVTTGAIADPRIRLQTQAMGDQVLIEVEDNGPGVPQDVGDRIFEPFFTTHAYGGGRGLGLHVARNAVAGQGGELSCRSIPGQTVFRIVLPATSAGEAPMPRLPRLLLVDDDPLVARTLGRTLRSDWQVEVAHSADAASSVLAAAGEPYQALVTDIGMPGRSGWDLVREIRRVHPALFVNTLVITGGPDAAPPDLADVPVLRKPFTPDDLRQALRFAS